ncbi:sodium:proton antiporter [Flavihumibacter sp. R14]|nr:sodium:proton antiporter [Flavihumibacter soli]
MDEYVLIISIIGLAALAMAWMPAITAKTGISYSIIYVAFGALLYTIFDFLPVPDVDRYEEYAVHITELVVIISLMGSGLKIDQPFSFRGWRVPFRLVIFTMVLCIGAVAVSSWWVFKFDWASALLLGAVLAPTDPVLASDVQVGPPHEEEVDNVRFSLTAEAGLNDGTAFPFVWLAIAVAIMARNGNASIQEWLLIDVLYRIIAGVASGFVLGKVLGFLVFDLPIRKNFLLTRDGFIAIAATLLVYGVTELIHGYGFIAVFVCALTMRAYERQHKFHKRLHEFTDQIERILLAIVLILFGGALVTGILERLNWQMVLFVLVFIFIIRPATAYIALSGPKLHYKEKGIISFFGIRGIGSFFYLSFALSVTYFNHGKDLWAIVAFVVLVSVVVHGLTAAISLKRLKEQVPEDDIEILASK